MPDRPYVLWADYIAVARRHLVLMAVLVVAGLGAGIAGAKVAPRTYEATATVLVRPTGVGVNNPGGNRAPAGVNLDTEAPERSSVEVTIDAASIDTRVADRDVHLRSQDFFDVERFPTLTFRSRKVEGPVGRVGDVFRVVGDLTIRGVTREVVLDARFEGMGTDPWGGSRCARRPPWR